MKTIITLCIILLSLAGCTKDQVEQHLQNKVINGEYSFRLSGLNAKGTIQKVSVETIGSDNFLNIVGMDADRRDSVGISILLPSQAIVTGVYDTDNPNTYFDYTNRYTVTDYLYFTARKSVPNTKITVNLASHQISGNRIEINATFHGTTAKKTDLSHIDSVHDGVLHCVIE